MVSLDQLSHIFINLSTYFPGSRRDVAMATLDRLSREVDAECGGKGYYATSLLETVQAELAAGCY